MKTKIFSLAAALLFSTAMMAQFHIGAKAGSNIIKVEGKSFDDQFRFGYSYDFGIYNKGFRGLQTSTHEVTFGWNFEYKKGKKKFRYIKCPKF